MYPMELYIYLNETIFLNSKSPYNEVQKNPVKT
jgi:hypothetical protein